MSQIGGISSISESEEKRVVGSCREGEEKSRTEGLKEEREETGKATVNRSIEGPHSSRPDDPTDSALVSVLELGEDLFLSFHTQEMSIREALGF